MTPTEPRSNIVSCILGPYRLPMAVMFVDLDHFVKICADVPAEDVFIVIEKFQRIVADTVSSFKGEINAYQGDGVLATFSNLAGPGCATRTLGCAWKILERIRALDLDQAIGGEQEISASIGLQYGQVWTGTIGISRRFGSLGAVCKCWSPVDPRSPHSDQRLGASSRGGRVVAGMCRGRPGRCRDGAVPRRSFGPIIDAVAAARSCW